MPTQSVAQRIGGMSAGIDKNELLPLVLSLRADLEALRVLFNAHVHGGVTVGAANSTASTTLAPALNTIP